MKISILLLMLSAVLAAQSTNGYVFFAPGGVTESGYTSTTFHAGGGVDLMIAKGIGANIELGAIWPSESPASVVGMFSPGATYYFRRGKELKLEPFVSGGYTLMFREGHANLGYVGGGVNYWMSRKVGLRAEFRDHIAAQCCSTVNYWGIRIGLAFR